MPATRRVQLSRIYDVDCTPPGPWANPFTSSSTGHTAPEFRTTSRLQSVQFYENWLRRQPGMVEKIRQELKGKRLGCVCHPGTICHVDVLVKIAESTDQKRGRHG